MTLTEFPGLFDDIVPVRPSFHLPLVASFLSYRTNSSTPEEATTSTWTRTTFQQIWSGAIIFQTSEQFGIHQRVAMALLHQYINSIRITITLAKFVRQGAWNRCGCHRRGVSEAKARQGPGGHEYDPWNASKCYLNNLHIVKGVKVFHVCQNGLDSREAWCISKPSPISRIWIIVI